MALPAKIVRLFPCVKPQLVRKQLLASQSLIDSSLLRCMSISQAQCRAVSYVTEASDVADWVASAADPLPAALAHITS